MPVSGAVNFRSPWVDSTRGAPARMNTKLGRKVKKVATEAAPFSGGFEWFYALISVAAFIALWKYKQDIMKVIGACAAIGLVHTYIV